MSARCIYLSATEGVYEPASTCFIQVDVNSEGLIGFAPPGFFPNPLKEVMLPLAQGDPGSNPVLAQLGIVPH
eukprot:2167311-Karenia_brevis.AAC.1